MPGQYFNLDSIKPLSQNTSPEVDSGSLVSKGTKSTCCCGRGAAKKDGREFCKQVEHGNKSRCKCYTSMGGCTHKCKCVNCGNPYGKSGIAKKTYTQLRMPRYRPKQKFQEVASSTSSIEYLINIGIDPNTGWTDTESFIADCLVSTSLIKKLCIESTVVHENYSRICELCHKQQVVFQLTPKKLKQIEGKLHYINKTSKGV